MIEPLMYAQRMSAIHVRHPLDESCAIVKSLLNYLSLEQGKRKRERKTR